MNNQKGLAPLLIIILVAAIVGGYLIYQKQFKPVPLPIIQSSPSPITTSTATNSAASPVPNGSGETTNWKTYTNSKYGFSFTYPENWLIGESKYNTEGYFNLYLRSQFLKVGDAEHGVISLIIKNSDLSLAEYINTLCGDGGADRCDNSKITTVVNFKDLVGKRVSPIAGVLPVEAIVFAKDNKTFQFNMLLDSKAKPIRQNLIIRDQILSTFKFTDRNQAMSCAETYRDLQEALNNPLQVCYLDLSNKNLTELPKEILRFSNLKSLYLNFNKLTTLPAEIKDLKNLTSIDLTGNQITLKETERIRSLFPKVNILNIQPMNLPK